MKKVILLVAVGALGAAFAQSINIDIGVPGVAPPGGYGAAGMPGAWNKFEAVDSHITYSLFDLYGRPTGATVKQIGGTEILDAPLGGPGDPVGPDALLLKDALLTHSSVENCLFFHGLALGTYEVSTYAWMPGQPATQSNVHIDTNPNYSLVGGSWPGLHTENVSYARHVVQVTNGFLGPHSGVPAGGSYAIGAALNGIQLRLMGVEPPLFVSRSQLSWLPALNAESYDLVRGDLRLLHDSGGDFSVATEQCLADDYPSTVLEHSEAPAPGEVVWFLARGVSSTGSLTYDSPGSSQVGSRDDEIAAAEGSCR